MSEAPRPWWASDPDEPAAGAADDDPLVSHRAARRGHGVKGAAGDAGGGEAAAGRAGGEPAADGSGDTTGDGRGGAHGADGHGEEADGRDHAGRDHADRDHADRDHVGEVCGVCPLCTLARSLGETRPELLGHLAQAAHHLSAAVRTLVEPPSEGGAASAADDEDVHGPQGGDGPRRIDLDP